MAGAAKRHEGVRYLGEGMKRTVKQNRYGNWRGYEGRRFVREFDQEPTALVATNNPTGLAGNCEMPEKAQQWLLGDNHPMFNERVSKPTLKHLHDYLCYQYPATRGDIRLEALCQKITAAKERACDCGHPSPSWHGDQRGAREYCCDACYERPALLAAADALKKLWAVHLDLGKSNPGFLGKLALQNYARYNEAMGKAPAALARLNEIQTR